jgi:hypothetical protein
MNGEEYPQYILCVEVIANDSLNAVNLRRHSKKKTASLVNNPLEFLERKLLEMRKQLNLMKRVATASTKALLSSFESSCLIAKSKRLHTNGETLLLPAIIKMCEMIFVFYWPYSPVMDLRLVLFLVP